jgi:hypothetical protein
VEAPTGAFIAKGRLRSYFDGIFIDKILRPHASLLGGIIGHS